MENRATYFVAVALCLLALAAQANADKALPLGIWHPPGMVYGASMDYGDGRDCSKNAATPTLGGNGIVTDGYYEGDGAGDYLQYPDSSEYSFTDGAGTDQPFSVACWFLTDAIAEDYIIAKWEDTGGHREWSFNVDSAAAGAQNVIWRRDSGTIYRGRALDADHSVATWYCMVTTYDGSESGTGMTCYINSTTPASSTLSSGAYSGMTDGPAPLMVGAIDTSYGSFCLDGKISDIRLYDYKLSADEVEKYFHEGRE